MPQNDDRYSSLAEKSEVFLRDTVRSAMADYEIRDPQLKLIGACSENIEMGGVLLAEAGTGTGKTYAYLIPIILSGKRAIISTKTINLQAQIVFEDLAFLSELIGFSYAIAKGRKHYLCMRRFYAFKSEDAQELAEYNAVRSWL